MIRAEDIATRNVKTISPHMTIRQAAQAMAACNVGFLPVVERARVVGVLTDRDIALQGLDPGAANQPVERIMTKKLVMVLDSATVADVAEVMSEKAVRRLLVTSDEGGLAGVISLDDLALYTIGDDTVSQILRKIAMGTPLRLNEDVASRPIAGLYSRPIEGNYQPNDRD